MCAGWNKHVLDVPTSIETACSPEAVSMARLHQHPTHYSPSGLIMNCPSFRQLRLTVSALIVAIALQGCGVADPYGRNEITGFIKLDGSPLSEGSIVFFPTESGPVVSGTTIKDGVYQLARERGLPAGSYKVTIESRVVAKPSNKTAEEQMELPDPTVSIIPAEYNSKSTLSVDVRDGEKNVFDFDLKSK
jgi:hypothetical protein